MKAVFEWLGEDTRDWDVSQIPNKSYIYHSEPEVGIIYTTTNTLPVEVILTQVESILTTNERNYLRTVTDFTLVTHGRSEILEIVFYETLVGGLYRVRPASTEILDILKAQDSYGYTYYLVNI